MFARIVKLLFPKQFGHLDLIRYQNICHGFLQKKSCRTIQVACCMCVPLLRHVYPTWWLMEVSFLKLNLFGFQHVTLQKNDISYLGKRKKQHLQKYLGNQGIFLFPKQSFFWGGLKTFLTLTRRKSHQVASFCNIEEDLPTEDESKRCALKVKSHGSSEKSLIPFRDPGSPKLRMVPWKLNTMRFGDWTP